MIKIFLGSLVLAAALAPVNADAAGRERRLSKRLLGVACDPDAVRAPEPSPEARRGMEAKLAEARAAYERRPEDPDAVIWLGRRTAYLGRFKEAIDIYTEGLKRHPRDARLYRHRGHRYITARCFDEAVRDLETAAKLVKDKPDEVEPDGIPNARNTPTSTLNSNIYYHLGLAHYLNGDFERALAAYRECMKFSKTDDMLVATSHWLYMTLRRLNRPREAAQVLARIKDDLEIIENHEYAYLLKMYKGKVSPESLMKRVQRERRDLVTVGYGVGNWYLYNDQPRKALRTFLETVERMQTTSFGHIAAEVELRHAGLKDYPPVKLRTKTID
ncbi:MAG TPA: tetratricopeptide repeat protein [Pyrinomonadaceae bacterium]|nr:tetratricopeptide repeat protein [Pyrinomonadaceae bacterium]